MRQLSGKQIKTDDGRATLSQDGRLERIHVYRELFPATFPELVERNGAFHTASGHRSSAGRVTRSASSNTKHFVDG